MNRTYSRRCGTCDGPVTMNRKTEEIDNPYHDQEGHPMSHVRKIIVRGLGTWQCTRGCSDRLVKVDQLAASGKEEERGKGSDNVAFKGMSYQSQYVVSNLVRRPIAVRTTHVL